MTGLILRDYQHSAVDHVEHAWRVGKRSPLLVAPTGSGKTLVGVELIRRELARGGRCLFLAPRRELIHQTCAKLEATGIKYGTVMAADDRDDAMARVQVASADTLRSRTRNGFNPVISPSMIVIDECHLFATSRRAALIDAWPNARMVGLTATPARGDGKALGVLFDDLIDVVAVRDLVEQGYLCKAKYYSLSDPDLSRVSTVAGDYHRGQLAAAMDQAPLVGSIVETWLQHAGGRRTAVFAVNVAHSVHLTNEFRRRGVRAEHVDAKTPTGEREGIFARFRSGETQVLTNCTLASYGFDLPDLDCIVIARPTKSLVLFLQVVGRALRPAPGKEHALVLDHSGCVRRFGFADEQREWSLTGRVRDWRDDPGHRREGRAEPVKLRDCPECKALFSGQRQCPECGWFPAPRGVQVKTFDGELIEIGQHIPESEHARLAFYLGLRGHAETRGFRPGWAAHSFYEKFNEWPPREWSRLPATTPDDEVRRWLQYQRIRWLKGCEAARRRAHAGP